MCFYAMVNTRNSLYVSIIRDWLLIDIDGDSGCLV